MTALLGVVALAGAVTITEPEKAAGVHSLGGFAPFGADQVHDDGHWLWVARSFAGTAIACGNGCTLAIDGRLREGADFRRRFGLDSDCSDAFALLHAYAKVDLQLFDGLDADIALLLIDPGRRRVLLYRDPLGERGLRFQRDGERLVVCSRGSAIVALRGQRLQPDETAIAHFFALRAPPDDVAWMQGVEELPAGALLVIDDGRERRRRFAPPLPTASLRFRSDDEAAEAWQATLATAVMRASADVAMPALMLSGGIDSTLLAAFLDRRGVAVSWSVPTLPACDESALAIATAARLQLRHVLAPTGDHLPLDDLPHWPMEDEAPLANPYRRLNQALFATARDEGAKVLLSGNFGDHVYARERDWPASFVHERGLLAFAAECVVQAFRGRVAPWQDAGLRGLLPRFRGGKAWQPPWLTDHARDRLCARAERHGSALRLDEAFGRASAQDAELARRFANMCGLELRFPYRDPILLTFVLALPAHYSESRRGAKWLSRRVLSGRVPEAVRQRPKLGSLTPLFQFGVLHRHRAEVESILWADTADWPRYVRREALRRAFATPDSDQSLLPIWLALSYELWCRAQRGFGPAVLASSPMPVEPRNAMSRDLNPVVPSDQDDRASYAAPALRELGDVRDLTLGSSPGTGDSGGAGTFKAPGRSVPRK